MGQSIAALDLGTSKSIAIVAQKDYAGKLSISRIEALPSKNAIRRGRIYNSDETAEIISKLVRKLNNNPDTVKVEKIYVGIGGQSLHTQSFKVERKIEGETITKQLLKLMKEEADAYLPEFEENLGAVSCEYYVDGQLVLNPQGIDDASLIEAHFLLIAGNPCLKRNLEKVFGKKEISVADYFISPLATAEAVLTSVEKERGCALVELGDGITYISIYKNKALKYLITLPLGGLAITKDIRSLNVSDDEAEVLKIEQGSVLSELADDDAILANVGYNPSRKVKLAELNRIVECRVDEIVKNIETQIQNSGYSQTLDAGIVITGGGALLRNLPQYIRNQTGKEVRLADARAWITRSEIPLSPADSCVAGLAVMGKESCVKETLPKEKDQSVLQIFDDLDVEKVAVIDKGPKSNFFKKVRTKIIKTFDDGVIIFKEDESDNIQSNNTVNKQ